MKKGILGIGLIMMALSATPASAALSDLAGNVQGEFSSFLSLAVTFSYVTGFFMVLASIFKFKQHSDDPRQTPLKTPVAFLIVAILLLGAPTLLGAGGESVFGNSGNTTTLDGSGAESIGFGS